MKPPKPLTPSEQGQGSHISPARIEEMRRYCVWALSKGKTQKQLSEELGAGRSRISRWCIVGIEKYGSPTDHRLLKTHDRKTLTQMMWARIEVGAPDECWPWRGAIKPNGYGALNYHGTGYNAHRLVYETLLRPIPDALVVDHVCRNPRCCNPHHLQLVSQSVNLTLGVFRRRAA